MRSRWLCFAMVTLGFGSIGALTFAQDAKPWEQPGVKVGDEITGPDGGKMVWVPAGEFDMGQEGVRLPVHHVRISKGFWLAKCTVTNAQYQQYCQEAGVEFPGDSDQGDDHPVVCVSWAEAAAYCKHHGLALPTEAQWEYAARGPEGRTFPWGVTWDSAKCCSKANKGPKGRTFPVGSFPEGVSWCGALDMAGNVWQWCQDWFSKDYYANSRGTDPPGPDAGDTVPDIGPCRVLRGGSWCHDGSYCISAVRHIFDPSKGDDCNGFRCCTTP